jgi:hypothetical protein
MPMPNEIKGFDVRAINQHGVEISMAIVQRGDALILHKGLDHQVLSLPESWVWQDLEREIQRLSGVTRMVVT